MSGRRDVAPVSRRAANVAARAAAAEPAAGTAVQAARSAPRHGGGRDDGEFMPSALLLHDEPPSPVRRVTVLLLAAMVLSGLAWAYFGRLASYATATGKVQAVGRTKVLEAQQSGQVVAIVRRDGDRVAAGDVVLELDPATGVAARDALAEQRADLLGQADRLRAEIAAARAAPVPEDPAVAWSGEVPSRIRDREAGVLRADLAKLAGTLATLASRRAAAVADVKKYEGVIEAQKALVAVTAENSAMADDLQKSGWNSRAKQLDIVESLREQQVSLTTFQGKLADARAAVATLDAQTAKAREGFVSDDTDALAAAERQVAELDQEIVKAERTVAQDTVRAPVGGIIHASAVTTLGQFVRPSEQLMQIVPEKAAVEVIAFVDNSDVGLVRTGQDATIKVDSFNYATYGTVDGTVASLGGDALPMLGKSKLQSDSLDGGYGESTAAQRTGSLKFQVVVHAPEPWLTVDGRRVPLAPGMSVTVEIETENRRLIDYVVSPLLELLSTAAHER